MIYNNYFIVTVSSFVVDFSSSDVRQLPVQVFVDGIAVIDDFAGNI